jgi:ATP-dependent Clp protease ATP-binding subunit ClpC
VLRHNYIGTEHLLLGLLREEEGLAARVLESLGVTIDEVRVMVRTVVGEGDEAVPGQIPFTPKAKQSLELALREALSLGHNHIGTEHLLLGLVRRGESVGVEILGMLGASAEVVHEEVIRMLSGPGRIPRQRPPVPPPPRRRALPPVALLVAGWLLFAVALGVGVLIGWAIWS